MGERDIILLGGKPGSGKSHLARELVDTVRSETTLRAAHLSLGERFRAIASGSIGSRYTPQIMNHLARPDGVTFPIDDELAASAVAEAIDEQPEVDILLLDGYPRYESQVRTLGKLALERDLTIRGLIVAHVPYDIAAERLRRRSLKHPNRALHEDDIQLRLLRHELAYPAVQHELHNYGIPAIEVDSTYEKERTHALGRVALFQLMNRTPSRELEAH